MFDCEFIKTNFITVRNALDAMGKGGVKLLAATKTQPKEIVDFVLENRLADCVGENRVQEFTEKYDEDTKDCRHFIGRLQTNKVKYLVGKAAMIQSLDSLKLAAEIEREAEKRGVPQVDCLVEINVGGEEAKGGVLLENTEKFLDDLQPFGRIKIKGLMGVLPKTDDQGLLCSLYGKLGAAYSALAPAHSFEILSAGMSGDWRAAVEYAGSNMIRLGAALFGAREKKE